jgi:hypothetical protein
MQLQSLKQGDQYVTQFLHKAKALSDELKATNRLPFKISTSICLQGAQIRILRSSDKNAAPSTPVSCPELHNLLLNIVIIK